MKDALIHIHDAIEELRRSAGPVAVISILEDAQASLMHDIFGKRLGLKQHHRLDDRPISDWTLGPDEPMPHHGEAHFSISEVGYESWSRKAH
jgi:hypothetical protein